MQFRLIIQEVNGNSMNCLLSLQTNYLLTNGYHKDYKEEKYSKGEKDHSSPSRSWQFLVNPVKR